MKMKKMTSLVLALVMCVALAVPAMAAGRDRVEIIVESEDEILEFISSPQYDQDEIYTFIIYSPCAMRILCPSCGYNTLIGETSRELDPNDPGGQGRTHGCPEMGLSPDVVTEWLVFTFQQCRTCGYESTHEYVEKEYEIHCSLRDKSFVATDWKTENHFGDIHEWKTSWDF